MAVATFPGIKNVLVVGFGGRLASGALWLIAWGYSDALAIH